MYRIIASDLDGTLLLPDHTISSYAKSILKLLTDRELNFVFATGRHYVDVGHIRDSLEIKAYMITSNGARVHDKNDCLIFTHNLDMNVATDLFSIAYNNPIIITNIYRNEEWFTNRSHQIKMCLFRKEIFNCSSYRPSSLKPDGVSKIFFTCNNHEELILLEGKINTRWGNRVNVSFSTLNCLEVVAGGVSKGHALKVVAQSLGYTLKDCIAFGDGMNDSEMLSMVGKGCIMANAHQRLKNLYPNLEIIGTNAENAVPHYLQKLFLDT